MLTRDQLPDSYVPVPLRVGQAGDVMLVEHRRCLSGLRTTLERSLPVALGAFMVTISAECGKDAKRPERYVYASNRDIDHEADPFPGGRPVTTSTPGNDPDDGN